VIFWLTIGCDRQLVTKMPAAALVMPPIKIETAILADGSLIKNDQRRSLKGIPMPRYFFDVEDGHRLFDAGGFLCDNDVDAVVRASVLAIGVSLDKPEDDPERRIAIINDDGREIGTVPVYSKPTFENPAH
jgi:hypothetical protein